MNKTQPANGIPTLLQLYITSLYAATALSQPAWPLCLAPFGLHLFNLWLWKGKTVATPYETEKLALHPDWVAKLETQVVDPAKPKAEKSYRYYGKPREKSLLEVVNGLRTEAGLPSFPPGSLDAECADEVRRLRGLPPLETVTFYLCGKRVTTKRPWPRDYYQLIRDAGGLGQDFVLPDFGLPADWLMKEAAKSVDFTKAFPPPAKVATAAAEPEMTHRPKPADTNLIPEKYAAEILTALKTGFSPIKPPPANPDWLKLYVEARSKAVKGETLTKASESVKSAPATNPESPVSEEVWVARGKVKETPFGVLKVTGQPTAGGSTSTYYLDGVEVREFPNSLAVRIKVPYLYGVERTRVFAQFGDSPKAELSYDSTSGKWWGKVPKARPAAPAAKTLDSKPVVSAASETKNLVTPYGTMRFRKGEESLPFTVTEMKNDGILLVVDLHDYTEVPLDQTALTLDGVPAMKVKPGVYSLSGDLFKRELEAVFDLRGRANHERQKAEPVAKAPVAAKPPAAKPKDEFDNIVATGGKVTDCRDTPYGRLVVDVPGGKSDLGLILKSWSITTSFHDFEVRVVVPGLRGHEALVVRLGDRPEYPLSFDAGNNTWYARFLLKAGAPVPAKEVYS